MGADLPKKMVKLLPFGRKNGTWGAGKNMVKVMGAGFTFSDLGSLKIDRHRKTQKSSSSRQKYPRTTPVLNARRFEANRARQRVTRTPSDPRLTGGASPARSNAR